MKITCANSSVCRPIEHVLCATIIVLKVYVLTLAWGKMQGFDAPAWLETFRATHWFQPLPPPRALLASYHPPLSYLLSRIIFSAIPQEVQASQVLSTLALLVAFLAFRSALQRMGVLRSLPGLWLLYGGFSLPLYVWLAIETGYDGLVMAWFMLALSLSVWLFWQPQNRRSIFTAAAQLRLLALTIVLVAGMVTKYSGLMAFTLPFLVIVIRRGPRALARECKLPLIVSAVAMTILAPFYFNRYYTTEHEWMPSAMEWQKDRELTVLRLRRDAAPADFLMHMLRIPSESVAETKRPVMDSFIHSVWFHTWKRDKWLGPQPEPSLSISNFYSRFAAYLAVLGSAMFLLGSPRGKEQRVMRNIGWLLLTVTMLFSISALAFAWKYPIWGWRVFKAKYMAPAILWVAFATWVPLGAARLRLAPGTPRLLLDCCVTIALFAFMLTNHLLPVY